MENLPAVDAKDAAKTDEKASETEANAVSKRRLFKSRY
jgi:hypothetical protein